MMYNFLSGLWDMGSGGCAKPPAVNISFQAINPDDCPISGAVYRLTAACGKYINAITDKRGCAVFRNVCPGSYVLTQVAAPYGYRPDSTSHAVSVTCNNGVKIDGLPARCFQAINQKETVVPVQSDPPGVAPINTKTLTLTGTGIDGCRVKVQFPGTASNVHCTVVLRNGTWSLDVPPSTVLTAGETVLVTQTCPCRLASDPVAVTVTAG